MSLERRYLGGGSVTTGQLPSSVVSDGSRGEIRAASGAYGALDTTGLTDSGTATANTATLQAACDDAAVKGYTVRLPAGTITVNGVVNHNGASPNPIFIEGAGAGVTIIQRLTSTRIIDARGTGRGTQVALTADSNAGTYTATIATNPDGIVAGDILEMNDPTILVGHATTGEYVSVKTITGAGPYTITFSGSIEFSYKLANAATLCKMAFLNGGLIRGITFKQTAANRGDTAQAVYFAFVKRFRIQDCEFRDLDWPGIQPDNCLGGSVRGCHFENLIDNVGANRLGYGVNLGDHSEDFRMYDCTSRWVRHLFTLSNSGAAVPPTRHYKLFGCIAVETSSQAYAPHQEGYYGTFVDCEDHNGKAAGFYLRHPFVTIVNPVVTSVGNGNHPIWFDIDPTYTGTVYSADGKVVGGRLVANGQTGTTYGIAIDAARVTVTDTRIDGFSSSVAIGPDTTRQVAADTLIQNIRSENPASDHILTGANLTGTHTIVGGLFNHSSATRNLAQARVGSMLRIVGHPQGTNLGNIPTSGNVGNSLAGALITSLVQFTGAQTMYEKVKGSASQNEVQVLRIVGTPTAGTITFTWNGNSSAATNLSGITAAAIQTALEGITGIGAGQVSVTSATAGQAVTDYTITFTGTLALASQPQMTAATAGGAFNFPTANRLIPLYDAKGTFIGNVFGSS